MTAEATTTEENLKAPIAWSALSVVIGGYLWALLDVHAMTLIGLLVFVVIALVGFVGLRNAATQKIVPLALFVVALVAAVVSTIIL